jgi:Sulfotransferase family
LTRRAGCGDGAAMKTYDPNSALFSMHIPKCGGTSLLRALQKWFWRWRVIEHYQRKAGAPPATAISAKFCVHGHFSSGREFGVLQYYPQADQFITFLREPFDRYLSLWHFMPKMAQHRGDQAWLERPRDFETDLRRRARLQRARQNFHSIVWHFPQRPDVAAPDAQMDRSYVFVGVMERYQDSLDALAAALGKRRVKIPHLNKTARENNDYEKWRQFYRKHFADEYQVYEAALRRNDELLRRYL